MSTVEDYWRTSRDNWTDLLRSEAALLLRQLLIVIFLVVQFLRWAEKRSPLWGFLHAHHRSSCWNFHPISFFFLNWVIRKDMSVKLETFDFHGFLRASNMNFDKIVRLFVLNLWAWMLFFPIFSAPKHSNMSKQLKEIITSKKRTTIPDVEHVAVASGGIEEKTTAGLHGCKLVLLLSSR